MGGGGKITFTKKEEPSLGSFGVNVTSETELSRNIAKALDGAIIKKYAVGEEDFRESLRQENLVLKELEKAPFGSVVKENNTVYIKAGGTDEGNYWRKFEKGIEQNLGKYAVKFRDKNIARFIFNAVSMKKGT